MNPRFRRFVAMTSTLVASMVITLTWCLVASAVSISITTPSPGTVFSSQAKIAINGTISTDAGETSFIYLISYDTDGSTVVSTDNAVWDGNGDTTWTPGYVYAPVEAEGNPPPEEPFKIEAQAVKDSSAPIATTKVSVKVKGPVGGS